MTVTVMADYLRDLSKAKDSYERIDLSVSSTAANKITDLSF
jgi:hypothetical protein